MEFESENSFIENTSLQAYGMPVRKWLQMEDDAGLNGLNSRETCVPESDADHALHNELRGRCVGKMWTERERFFGVDGDEAVGVGKKGSKDQPEKKVLFPERLCVFIFLRFEALYLFEGLPCVWRTGVAELVFFAVCVVWKFVGGKVEKIFSGEETGRLKACMRIPS